MTKKKKEILSIYMKNYVFLIYYSYIIYLLALCDACSLRKIAFLASVSSSAQERTQIDKTGNHGLQLQCKLKGTIFFLFLFRKMAAMISLLLYYRTRKEIPISTPCCCAANSSSPNRETGQYWTPSNGLPGSRLRP